MMLEIIQNCSLKKVAWVLFFSLSLFGIVSSSLMMIVGYSVHEFLQENRAISDENNLLTSSIFLVGSYVSVSVTSILLHVMSLIIHRFAKMNFKSPRYQMKLLGLMLLMQIIATILITILYILHQRYHANTVQNIVSDALQLIGKYDKDQSVRNSLDTLQTKYHCCGFKDFRDWFLYRNFQPDDSPPEENNEIEGDSNLLMTSTSHPSLPDSCCDPFKTYNLCLLSSKFERNNSEEFREGCTKKMEDDLGKWLQTGSALILISLLNEIILVPLMIVYCQVFAGYILLNEEVPEQFPSFTAFNVNQNNRYSSSDEEFENIDIDFDKSSLVANMYFHNAHHIKPNSKQKKTKVFVRKEALKSSTDSDSILSKTNTNHHANPHCSSSSDSLSSLNLETSVIYSNPWSEIREINENQHALYSVKPSNSTISGIQDIFGSGQPQEPPRANSTDSLIKTSVAHEPETLETTSPPKLEEDFEEFEEIGIELPEEGMKNEFNEVEKAEKEIEFKEILDPEGEASKMSPQAIFISDLEDSVEIESSDVKVTSQHLSSDSNLSNDFKTEDQVITVDSLEMFKKPDRKKFIISKDKPFSLPRERIYKKIYVPIPSKRKDRLEKTELSEKRAFEPMRGSVQPTKKHRAKERRKTKKYNSILNSEQWTDSQNTHD